MKLLPKIIRRCLVLWCVYGLAKLCIFVNPFVMLLGKHLLPGNHEPDWVDNMNAWVFISLGICVVVAASIGLHYFSKWLFNERN